jgi:hypothetical protein
MPAPPNFSAAPNQTSNLTSGWTSKTIYSYQDFARNSAVNQDDDVFKVVPSNVFLQKGSSTFAPNYFATPNINQGRSIKITMYFAYDFDGQTIEMQTGLVDINTSTSYIINPFNAVTVDSTGGLGFGKYECYINVFDNLVGSVIMQATGAAVVQTDAVGRLRSMAINGDVVLSSGFSAYYRLSIINKSSQKIFPTNVLVEEIG